MNLVTFLENRYQELKLESDKKNAFDVLIDSEINATHKILTRFRKTTELVLIPKVLYNFVQMKLGYREEPIPVLINKLKEDQKKELEKKAAQKSGSISQIGGHVGEKPSA